MEIGGIVRVQRVIAVHQKPDGVTLAESAIAPASD
jgi:hypothetical protein